LILKTYKSYSIKSFWFSWKSSCPSNLKLWQLNILF